MGHGIAPKRDAVGTGEAGERHPTLGIQQLGLKVASFATIRIDLEVGRPAGLTGMVVKHRTLPGIFRFEAGVAVEPQDRDSTRASFATSALAADGSVVDLDLPVVHQGQRGSDMVAVPILGWAGRHHFLPWIDEDEVLARRG